MQPDGVDHRVLTKYLLGDLSEEEQVQIEDRAFADKDYLNELEAAEADLIDAYVHGGLSQSERRAFERRFLPSPQRRRKVQFARDFASVSAEFKATENHLRTPQPGSRSLLDMIRGWTPELRLAAAVAGVVVTAAVCWLAVENTHMRSRVAALEAGRREVEAREQALRQELNEQQRHPIGVAPPVQQQADSGKRGPLIVSLALFPGLSRGETAVPQLRLSPSAQIANIEIQLEPRDDYPRFRAELRSRSGEEILIANNVRSRRTEGGFVVSVAVASNTLASGEYEIALKGIGNNHTVQDVGYYYFSVQKQ